MRHFALSRLKRGFVMPPGCFHYPTRLPLCFLHGHKISSLHLDGAAASCPSFCFDVAKISILFYMFQIIVQ